MLVAPICALIKKLYMQELIGKPATDGIVFKEYIKELGSVVAFRSLDLDHDLELVHQWVNAEYARRFWGLRGKPEMIRKVYAAAMANPDTHAFIGLIEDQPFCQIDVYAVKEDELQEHIEWEAHDAGFHILMCPPRQMKRRWSYWAIKCFQQYYFSQENAQRLFAEPDQHNHPANQLAINTGFNFVKSAALSYKTANIYSITREDFYANK